MIGDPVNSAEKQAALVEMLRRKSAFGAVGQLSGDKVLAPMGADQQQQAQQQAQQIGRNVQADRSMAFQQQQEAREAADRQQQFKLTQGSQDLTKRGQDLDYSQGLERTRAMLEAAQAKADKVAEPTEGERKAATLGVRLEGALRTLKDIPTESQKPGWLEKGAEAVGMDTGANLLRSPDRQIANGAQLDALDAALTLATGASYTKEQLANLRSSYFPQIGDTDKQIESKNARFATIVDTAKLAAGRAGGAVDKVLGARPPTGAAPKKVKRTGKHNGRPVVEYDDGTVSYADQSG